MLNEAQIALGSSISAAREAKERKQREISALRRVVHLLKQHPDVDTFGYDYAEYTHTPEGFPADRLTFTTYVNCGGFEDFQVDLVSAEGVRAESGCYSLEGTQKFLFYRKNLRVLEVHLVFVATQAYTEEERDLLRAVGTLQKRVSITVSGATEEQMELLRSLSNSGVPWISDTLACGSR